MRRELWETVTDLMESILPEEDAASLLRVQSASFDVPIEVFFHQRGDELELRADLPRWRWATVFDEQRGRLRLFCRESEFESSDEQQLVEHNPEGEL
jgi:hypothetical protein